MSSITVTELTEIFQDVKRNTIIALRQEGLSLNEIVRRLGGSTKPVVKRILDEEKKEIKDYEKKL